MARQRMPTLTIKGALSEIVVEFCKAPAEMQGMSVCYAAGVSCRVVDKIGCILYGNICSQASWDMWLGVPGIRSDLMSAECEQQLCN